MDHKKIGFTCGAMDLLHAGHILMLKEVRAQCDHLIVGLQTDPSLAVDSHYRGKIKNSPIQSLEERRIQLEACRYVDEIRIYDTEADLYELLQNLPIEVRFIGADWEGKQYTGYDLDIPVIFNSREHGYSSSELRARICQAENAKNNF